MPTARRRRPPAAARTDSMMRRTTPSGPSSAWVGRSSLATTRMSSSTTMLSILVPPRSTAPRKRSSAMPPILSLPRGPDLTRAPPARVHLAAEPVEDDFEALDPVTGLAGARHLVVVLRKAPELDPAAQELEAHIELLRLLDRAAEVVLGVDYEQRRAYVVDISDRRRAQEALRVFRRYAADLVGLEVVAFVCGADHREGIVDGALGAG